jgi:hypothetical protein
VVDSFLKFQKSKTGKWDFMKITRSTKRCGVKIGHRAGLKLLLRKAEEGGVATRTIC